MVITEKKYNNNSIILSVIIIIFVMFTPLFNVKLGKGVFSLISDSDFVVIKGKLLKSPVKQGNGKYYSSTIDLYEATDKNGLKTECNGILPIFIPTEFVEAHFPGKLYSISLSHNNCVYEQGGIYTLSGKNTKKGFYVKDCSDNEWQNNFWGKIDYNRALLRLQFKRLMHTWGNAGGFLLALLSGSKEYTQKELSDAFTLSGLSHILALSGMHLSLFSGIAMFLGKKAKRKKLSFIIRIIALILFVWFAGFSPSLLRAFICAILVVFSSMADIPDPDMLQILCFSFIIQIIISPLDLYNTGFILSYGALAGIIIFNSFFKKLYIKFMTPYFSSSLSSSTSAQIITVPISLKLFGSYSPIGIIATCFVSPLITLFIYIGLFFILLSLILPFMSNISAFFMNFLYNIIKILVMTFSKVPVWSIN